MKPRTLLLGLAGAAVACSINLSKLHAELPAGTYTYIQIDDDKGKYGTWASPDWMKYFGLTAGNLTDARFKDVVSGRHFYKNPGGDMTNGGANWRRVDLGFNVDAHIIVDVDGDEFGDILAQAGDNAQTKRNSTYLEIWWFEATDVQGLQWTRQNGGRPVGRVLKAGNHVLAHNFGSAQIEMGGKPEIYVTTVDGTYYFKLPQNPNDGPQDWARVKVTMGDGYNTCEAVADIDGDGHNDIVGTAAEPADQSQIIWWHNPGQPGKGDWKRYIVGSLNIERGATAVADVDGDGHPDVIAAEETGSAATRQGRIYWFKHPGKMTEGRPWPRKDVSGKYFSIQSLHAADLDGDGDIDFVAGEHRHGAKVSLSEMRLFVFENDGRGRFTRNQIAHGYDHHDGCKLADLDNDGDIDIISTGWDDDHWQYVRLWRNDARRPDGGP
jgi:hypothetical protein